MYGKYSLFYESHKNLGYYAYAQTEYQAGHSSGGSGLGTRLIIYLPELSGRGGIDHFKFQTWIINTIRISSGNRTPGSRFYSDLMDTSVCVHQLVLKRLSKR